MQEIGLGDELNVIIPDPSPACVGERKPAACTGRPDVAEFALAHTLFIILKPLLRMASTASLCTRGTSAEEHPCTVLALQHSISTPVSIPTTFRYSSIPCCTAIPAVRSPASRTTSPQLCTSALYDSASSAHCLRSQMLYRR